MNNWNCLKNRNIIDLFIGDSNLKILSLFNDIRMPHMTGNQICEFSSELGLDIDSTKESLSRWQMMEKVIDYAIENDKVNEFFKKMVAKSRFEYLVDLEGYYGDPEPLYWDIIHGLFNRINEYLRFKDIYIDYDLKNNTYNLVGSDEEVQPNDKDFNEVVKDFCKIIKKDGFITRYGKISKITDPGSQGGNGKILYGELNDKKVAIKVLITEDEKKKSRFFEEFLNVLMSLEKSKGIVELYLYDVIKFEGKEIQYIVMKKYEKNLAEYQINTQDELIKFALELAEIIDQVHEKGIIHRDIKPQNILLDIDGNLILTDFGIAYYDPDKFENTGHTISKELLGNRGFSSPEQSEKGISPKVTMDIYSYGQVLQYIVTGSPHNGTDKINIGRFINGDKINIVDKLINKCLRFEPEKRYQSMKEIINELKPLVACDKSGCDEEYSIVNDINSNDIYEFICINDVVSTKEIAKEFNYDLSNLKKELLKLFKVSKLIKPSTLSDIPDDDNCNWTRY